MSLFSTETEPPRRVTLIRLAGEIARSAAAIGRIAVDGEVHQPRAGRTGGTYFVLRDRVSEIRVRVAPSKASRCRVIEGERVCVLGSLSWENDRGQMQLVAEEVTPVGDGAVAAMLAEVRGRLVADGLVDRPRRSLPWLPELIGVVCGTDAAVRHDIESVVQVRYPGYPVVFVETLVSGPGAAGGIVAALAEVSSRAGVEVVILARGGGDATQLLPWSDEELCRAVAACPVPVVSAIGHDQDRPLCDEVADVRCGTPSIAAAEVVPDKMALYETLAGMLRAAHSQLERAAIAGSHRLELLDTKAPLRAGLARSQQRLVDHSERLALMHPRRSVFQAQARLAQLDVHSPARRRLVTAAESLRTCGAQLHSLSPARVLERGYALVRLAGGPRRGRVLLSAGDTEVGARLDLQLASGRLEVVVDKKSGQDT